MVLPVFSARNALAPLISGPPPHGTVRKRYLPVFSDTTLGETVTWIRGFDILHGIAWYSNFHHRSVRGSKKGARSDSNLSSHLSAGCRRLREQQVTRKEQALQSGGAGLPTEKPPPPQHLYLILDDWALGCSIRKLDLSSNDTDPMMLNGAAGDAAICLPSPFFRLKARRELPMYFTAALGSKIMAMHPKEDGGSPNSGGAFFDVHTRSLNFIPRHMDDFRPIYFSIGNSLLALTSSSFQLLDLPLIDDPSCCQLDSLSWRKLQDAPFDSMEVLSYAILPDEHTVLASVGVLTKDATFSFQLTDDIEGAWKKHGDWVLPFYGPGYFDPALNAWVGLSMYSLETGHICACCNLVSAGSDSGHCPTWDFSKENLFSDDPNETHVGAQWRSSVKTRGGPIPS
ncbi:hypothetical protein BAE44_0012171 [Dichanthelium oligosanthes]|uniref:Uncharacterized protein n=1 Tax=Dichanthelium oligosanthes TaxID=888268 RepID=A0A1E5VNV9_9POAL|nr:hypothetical protein BAE44_0012171 [Dichanthelium oligosanthes]